jgi:hypothetical protein
MKWRKWEDEKGKKEGEMKMRIGKIAREKRGS